MKNLYLILFLLIFFSSYSQQYKDFEQSTEYHLTEIDSTVLKEYWKNFPTENEPKPISIYLKDKKGEKLYEIKITQLETYDKTSIKVLKNDKLKNVEQIIQIKSDYDACCSNHYLTYLLKAKNGKLIELPETEYLHCDGPTPIFEYRFPNQKFGIENKILLVKSFRDDEYQVDSIEIQKTYNWNGETLELEK